MSTTTLRTLLDLTLQKAVLERRIALYRAEVDAQARSELETTGAAPTWKIKGLGQVRLDGYDPDPEPVAYVADDTAFADYVAQHHPTEATGTITLPADRVAEALQVLEFAQVPTLTTSVSPRPAATNTILGQVTLLDRWEGLDPETPPSDLPDPRWVAFDADGNEVTGVTARTAAANPRLVVAVDGKTRSAACEQVDAEWTAQHPEVEQPEQLGATA